MQRSHLLFSHFSLLDASARMESLLEVLAAELIAVLLSLGAFLISLILPCLPPTAPSQFVEPDTTLTIEQMSVSSTMGQQEPPSPILLTLTLLNAEWTTPETEEITALLLSKEHTVSASTTLDSTKFRGFE